MLAVLVKHLHFVPPELEENLLPGSSRWNGIRFAVKTDL
jgi:hypothetical protein